HSCEWALTAASRPRTRSIRSSDGAQPNPATGYESLKVPTSAFARLVPTYDRIRDRVGRCKIRLDVDERRAVETVEAHDREPVIRHLQQRHHAGCNRVRTRRRAQRERTAGFAVMTRRLQHEVAAGPVHPVEHKQ